MTNKEKFKEVFGMELNPENKTTLREGACGLALERPRGACSLQQQQPCPVLPGSVGERALPKLGGGGGTV